MSAQVQSHAELFERALAAARAALNATGRHDRGACGLAWVEIHPATGAFARWCKTSGHAIAMHRGLRISPVGLCGYRGQSVDVKEAVAEAFAAVLREAGIDARANSRLD